MKVIEIEDGNRMFEVDESIYEDVLSFLKELAKEKNASFSYIDDLGDLIVVVGGKEYVVPSKKDVFGMVNLKDEEFLEEEQVKDLLNV